MNKSSGFFSLIGIIITVVVIGVLATLTLNYYRQSGAEKTVNDVTDSAVDALLQADLVTAAAKIKFFQTQNGIYPVANDCSANPADNTICLSASNGNEYSYEANNNLDPKTYSLVIKNSNGTSYKITDSKTPLKVGGE